MNIKRILIKNLYGYLNKEVEFNKDINLLVGINGSGKTSILNALNWILVPSFSNLCVNEYEKIEVDFIFLKDEFRIISRQNEKEVTIDLENLTTKYKYQQIQADLEIHPKKIGRDKEIIDKLISDYSGLKPEKHEEETWNFIFSTLPNPIVIGLDRNLFTEEGDEITYLEDSDRVIRKRFSPKGQGIKSPLEKVMRLSSTEYMRFKNKILDLNRRLNDKIMLSSFDETLTRDSISEILKSPKISLKQVESLEINVKNYFKENMLDRRIPISYPSKHKDDAFKKIEIYFSNLKTILMQVNAEKKESLDILYITNLNQFRKIKELITSFEEFENKSKKFFDPLRQYLDTINIFLKDSSKELYFDKNTSRLKFRILDKNFQILKDNREIENLSSGEKQILILFTYIKFNNKLGKVFIIDEPELSLHPKWQENFLEGIKTVMPDNTQLLFATHSPAIVGKNKLYCKVLLPY
ncbi:AAA family ATPase [Daejeonella oryzae]|uniref:AAA family ATPase n=1 Tax=Daejeonella oryzae TaxID=1122943 RepID=UPI00041C78C4|nr:AAA family ATPase [Daejeonella oryzae]